jgi:predicted TIM-barrel fold metal-dependent hydrolase
LKDPLKSAQLARETNTYAAKLRDEKPKKYGFFAALPNLLDTELALEEIKYALDTLKADGVTLFTRYGSDNHYLGHADFKPIWTELNRRCATVFIHPTHPVDTNQVSSLPQPVIRYPFETTTTALDMIHNKTVRDNPNCQIILSHGGGVLPYLIGRPASIFAKTQDEYEGILEDARSFYYDLAVAGSEVHLLVLEQFAKPGHLLYGSDTPYANESIIGFHTRGLDAYKFKNPDLIKQINRDNALALFPQYK